MKNTQKNVPVKKVKKFTVYIPADLDAWIRQAAKSERRTLSAHTELVLLAGKNVLHSIT